MEDEFTCSICLEIAEDADETSCCHNIYCHACIFNDANEYKIYSCPSCRATLNAFPSKLARRVIGNMPVKCLNEACTAILTRSTLSDHIKTCPFTDYSCGGCTFTGDGERYLNHLITSHKIVVLENSSLLFDNSNHQTSNKNSLNDDRIIRRVNSYGREARLGSSGKYYCAKKVLRLCNCCDGNCGPENGCNCIACMKLDIEARKLPIGWFVNREGFACRKGETGKFYCGRFMQHAPRTICDGYCGPTNGPNCSSCKVIDLQFKNSSFANLIV